MLCRNQMDSVWVCVDSILGYELLLAYANDIDVIGKNTVSVKEM